VVAVDLVIFEAVLFVMVDFLSNICSLDTVLNGQNEPPSYPFFLVPFQFRSYKSDDFLTTFQPTMDNI